MELVRKDQVHVREIGVRGGAKGGRLRERKDHLLTRKRKVRRGREGGSERREKGIEWFRVYGLWFRV